MSQATIGLDSPYPKRAAGPPQRSQGRTGRRVFRALLGFIGEILITIGLFLLLYIVWQLWWTSYVVSGELTSSVSAFEYEHPSPAIYTEKRRTDDPPLMGDFNEGDVIGVLHVPGWEWETIPIAEGVSSWVLNAGYAGHYPDTQSVGQFGNFAVAAHRRAFGDTFLNIHTLKEGDPLVIETTDAFVVFKMMKSQVVQPSDVWVLDPAPWDPGGQPEQRLLTMTTCHPMYGNTERYIVWSEMEYWTAKADGRPEILQGEPKREVVE